MDGKGGESHGSVIENYRSGIDEEHARLPTRKRGRPNRNDSQTQKLEAFFKDCPYPDDKQNIYLAQELGLHVNQVKIWFQNKRTLMKNQVENDLLSVENARLHVQYMAAVQASRTSNVQHLISENAQLSAEFARMGITSYQQMQSNLCNNSAETLGSTDSIATGTVARVELDPMAQGKKEVSQSLLHGKMQCAIE